MTITEKEWFIEAPWGRMCIVAWGHCYNPPVLVCHGLMDSIVSFRSLINQLPKNFYYIGVELPGNGKSDPFPLGMLMSFYDLVYSLEVVVKHFRWEKFSYIGHSAGASTGLLYDFCFPGRMTKLVLLDPVTPTMAPGSFEVWYKRTYQKLFDDFDYYNMQKERRPMYTREEALKKLLKVDGMTEELAETTLGRVTEDAGSGMLRFTFDQRYKVMAPAPLSPDHLKALCQKTQAQVLIIAASESLKLGRYSKIPFMVDETILNNDFRTRQVELHHNIHSSPTENMVTLVSQFLLYGSPALDAKAKL